MIRKGDSVSLSWDIMSHGKHVNINSLNFLSIANCHSTIACTPYAKMSTNTHSNSSDLFPPKKQKHHCTSLNTLIVFLSSGRQCKQRQWNFTDDSCYLPTHHAMATGTPLKTILLLNQTALFILVIEIVGIPWIKNNAILPVPNLIIKVINLVILPHWSGS